MSQTCGRCGGTLDFGDRFCARCGAPVSAAPAAPPAAAPSPKRRAPIAIMVLGLVLGAGAPLFMLTGDGCGSTEGTMAVTGGPHGDFTFAPTGCQSMQPFGRFGATVHGEGPNDGAVYVTMDPTRGSAVEIEVPGSCRNANGTDCTVFSVPREQCTTFAVNVDFTGTVVNHVRLVEGYVRLDCALEDGTSVRGQLTFDGC